MHYKLYKILSDIAELLILFAAKRIDIEQLHKYICDDVDMFIKLNSAMFDIQNPCPVGDKTDIPKCPDIGFKYTNSLSEV